MVAAHHLTRHLPRQAKAAARVGRQKPPPPHPGLEHSRNDQHIAARAARAGAWYSDSSRALPPASPRALVEAASPVLFPVVSLQVGRAAYTVPLACKLHNSLAYFQYSEYVIRSGGDKLMPACAPQFYPVVLDAHFVARRTGSCGTGEDATITHTEARAVPGALHNIAFERAFIERPSGMRAGRGNSGEPQALAQQHDRNTRYHYAIQLVLLDLLNGHHRFKILAASFPGGMIDVGAFRENHFAAQVGRVAHDAQADKANDGSNTTIATGLSEPQDHRNDVQHQRARIVDGMIETNAAFGAIGIAPVSKTGNGSSQRTQNA